MKKSIVTITGLFMVMVFPACSVMKQAVYRRKDSLGVQQYGKNEAAYSQSSGHVIRLFRQTDSSAYNYLATIVPEGLFTFSPETGFSGKGRLQIWGKGYAVRMK